MRGLAVGLGVQGKGRVGRLEPRGRELGVAVAVTGGVIEPLEARRPEP